jgi:coenzyme F420-reducing hydrogenase delta subunit
MPELRSKKGMTFNDKTYEPGERSTGTADADVDQRRYDSLARVLDVRIAGRANPVVTAVTLHDDKVLIAGNSLNNAALQEIDSRRQLLCDVLLGETSVQAAAARIVQNSRFDYNRIEKDLGKLLNSYIGADQTTPELREKLVACVDNEMRIQNATRTTPGAVIHAEQALVFYRMENDSVHAFDFKAGITKLCCQTCHEFLTKFGVGHTGTHGGIFPKVYDPDTGKGLPNEVFAKMQSRGWVNPHASESSSSPNQSDYYSFSSGTGNGSPTQQPDRSPTQSELDKQYFDHYRKYLVDQGKREDYIKDYRKKKYSQKEAERKADNKLDKEAVKLVTKYKVELAQEQAKAAAEDSNVADLAARVATMYPYSPYGSTPTTYQTTYPPANSTAAPGYGGGQPTPQFQYANPLTGGTYSAAESRGEVPPHRPGVTHPDSYDEGYDNPSHSHHHGIR